MMEEAKQVLKPHTESLKDLALNSRIGWAKLSELEEKAEECETELKLQREELDKMDGMICDGFQDAGDDCDPLRARLGQVESQLKQLPERIKSETRADASEAIVAKARGDELHDDGSAAKTRVMSSLW